MSHPIQIEITFRELMFELEQTCSVRQQFTLICRFILSLNGEYQKYNSYLLQLAEAIPVYSCPTSYSGLDPALLEYDIRLLQDVSSQVVEMYDSEKFCLGLDRLRQVCIIQYGYAGALEQAVGHLDEWLESTTKFEQHPKQIESFVNHRARANRLHEVLMNKLETGNLKAEESQKIQKLCDELEKTMEEIKGSVLIPVVELHDSEPGGRMEYGRLLCISVAVKNKHDKEKDILTRRFNVAGGEQPLWPEGDVIAEAARSLISESESHLHNIRFLGDVDCDLKGAVHEGNSVNAAISALWYTGIQYYTDQRTRHEIRSNICITGDLQQNGELINVDINGIQHKVEAAFFSWCTALVVSSGQLEEFKSSLNKLRERYPGRDLNILGIDHLRELFFDRRLTKYTHVSKFIHALDLTWKYKYEAAGLMTILMLLAIIFRLVYGPLDKNPALAKFTGDMLQIQNETGSVIYEIQVGYATANLALANHNKINRKLVTFADLSGDGKNDIIWGEIVTGDGNQQYGFVRSKKAHSNHNYWSFPLRYDFDFPFKSKVIDQYYLLSKLRVGDYNGDGNKSLILSMDHPEFSPGILSLRDAYSGEEISHFVNTGHIMDFYMADITGDGRKEVIFCGLNSVYNMAFMAVLDIDKIEGRSPADENYQLSGYDVSPDIWYILLPSVVKEQNFLNDTLFNLATEIDVMEDDQIIRVRVYDSGSHLSDNILFARSYIEYYFRFDLTLLGNSTYVWYGQKTHESGEEKGSNSVPNSRNTEQHQNKLLYWNGDHFEDWQVIF